MHDGGELLALCLASRGLSGQLSLPLALPYALTCGFFPRAVWPHTKGWKYSSSVITNELWVLRQVA